MVRFPDFPGAVLAGLEVTWAGEQLINNCVCVFSIKYKNRLASFGKSLDMQRIGFPCHEERIEECNSKVFDVVLCSQKRTSSFISSTLDIPRVPNFAHHPWVHQPPDTRKWYSGSEPEKDNLPGEWHERLDPLQISGCRILCF